MKKLMLTTLLFSSYFGFSQDSKVGEGYKSTSTNSEYFKTPPLRSLLGSDVGLSNDILKEFKVKDGKKTNSVGLEDIGIPENNHIDPALQTDGPLYKTSTSLIESFNGLSGGGPPDPSGAAGKNHYVQGKNTSYRVYNKDGSGAGFLSGLNTLWPGSTNDGDPIIMYDRYADRWFISQFQTDTDKILIAISETSDPLGSYHAYTFDVPVGGNAFPDYPKFGVWSNGYYMSANCSSNNCVVFEREKMLLGQSAQMVRMNFPTSVRYFFRSFSPSYAEGETAPAPNAPFYYFHPQDNSWGGVSNDHIKVIKCEVDWTTTSNSSVVVSQEIPAAAFNSSFTASWDDITQPGTTQKIDAVPSIFMYKTQYRRFTTHNTAMMCMSVDVDNTNRAGIRWYELRENNDGVWYIHQESTYSPDNTNSRWMGSIAMDRFGHIGMAYSFAGPNDYAGLRFTGRFKDDPLNQMTVNEQIAIEGSGAQTNSNRFGDYAQMSMDPADDKTFWFTGEYLGNSGAVKTRIFSFTAWQLLGQEEKEVTLPSFNAYQPHHGVITMEWKDVSDSQLELTIFDLNGRIVISDKVNGQDNSKSYNSSDFSTGIYLVKLSGENTNVSKKIYLN
jgi:hypothetical protein